MNILHITLDKCQMDIQTFYAFLKRAAILLHFCLDIPVINQTMHLDWDNVFELPYLIKLFQLNPNLLKENIKINPSLQKDNQVLYSHFLKINSNDKKINNNEKSEKKEEEILDVFEKENQVFLPPFKLYPFPKLFLEFINPPYSFDVSRINKATFLDLFKGEAILSSDVHEYMNKNYSGSVVPLLQLTGECASSLFIVSSYSNIDHIVDGFYTDKYGNEDPGFDRGSIVKLHEEKLDNFIESLLSGKWVSNLPE